jgi:Ala-tRNA(Pro) deacylase
VAASEHVPAKELAKTVIVIADDRSVMVVVPASSEVQISQLARPLGAHAARLAEDPEFGPMFWTVSWERCRLRQSLRARRVRRRWLAEDESIVFQAGTHTDTMRTKHADFARRARPTMVDVAPTPSHRPHFRILPAGYGAEARAQRLCG